MCSHFSLLFLSTTKTVSIISFIFLLCIHVWWLSIGPCSQSGMPNIDYAMINKLNLIKPMQIHICMWIYCGISFLWLISSITLLTSTYKFMQISSLGTLLNQHSINNSFCRCSLCESTKCQLFFVHLDLSNGDSINIRFGTRCCFWCRLWHTEGIYKSNKKLAQRKLFNFLNSSMRRTMSESMKVAVPISHNTWLWLPKRLLASWWA